MTEARDIELLFAIWEQNVETVQSGEPKPEARLTAEIWDCASARKSSQAMRHWFG